MDILISKVRKFYEGMITIIVLAILTFLLFISSKSMTVITQSEHILFIKESFLFFLFPIVLSLAVLLLIAKTAFASNTIIRINSDEELYRKIRIRLCAVMFLLCLFWVLNTQMLARADQVEIQEAAFRVHLGDFGELMMDGYIGAHYNQIGLMLVSYLFSFAFGNQNYVVFQIFNSIATSVIYMQLADFGKILGLKNTGRLLVQTSGFFFYPIILFSSFVYGNIIGLALSLCAINLEYEFFEKKEIRYGLFSAALIALAAMIKPNFMIYMIGMIIYAIAYVLVKKDYRRACIIVFIIAFFCIQSYGTKALFEKMSGIDIGEGISPYAFAAMGLQEGGLGPGWYDGYNDLSYEIVKYDTRAQRQMAIWNIKDRLQYFNENREDAISFFTRKMAAQWNEPTYESLFILNEKSRYGIKISNWVWNITTVHWGFILSKIGKIFQIFVMVGALIYLLLVRKREDYYQKLTPLMIFIGGFTFHFVWEANGQYTIIFFILLIPYAVCGYSLIKNVLTVSGSSEMSKDEVSLEMERGIRTIRNKINVPSTIIAFVFIITFSLFYRGRTEFLTADTDMYMEYVEAAKNEVLVPNGSYSMITSSGEFMALVPNPDKEYSFDDDDRMMYIELSDRGDKIKVINYHGRVRLYVPEKNLYLQHDGEAVIAADYKDIISQLWIVKRSNEENIYYIIPCTDGIDTFDERMNVNMDYYLGYDKNGNVFMTDAENDGLWEFAAE